MNDILFYPFLSYYKSPVGAVRVNENINIKIKITKSFEIYNLLLHIYNDDNTEIITKPCVLTLGDDSNYDTYFNSTGHIIETSNISAKTFAGLEDQVDW